MVVQIYSANWQNEGKKKETKYTPVGALEISNSKIIAYGGGSMTLEDIIEGNIRRGDPIPSIDNADEWDEILPASLTNMAYIVKTVPEVASDLKVTAIYDRLVGKYTKQNENN